MAAPFKLTPPDVRYETQYIDQKGRLIGTLIYEETTVQDPNKPVTEVKRNAYIQTSDGLQFNVTQGKGDKPIHLAVCEPCRKPRLFGPTPHGLVARHEAQLCHDCGELCCPRHRKNKHGHWRCLPCHRKYKRSLLWQFLLYTRR